MGEMQPIPRWLEMQSDQFRDLLKAIEALGPTAVAVVVGLFIVVVGWRQWRTGKQKLRLDMFDRRYSMYEATKFLIDKIAINGQVSSADLSEFRRHVRGAEFLFDGEARKFFKSLIDLSLQADLARTKQAQAKDEAALGEFFDEEDQYLKLVAAEGPNLERIFARYLDLSKVGI
jgi:hypothetical protein